MLDHVTIDRLREAEQFLFHEARLADEHRYEEWERLWTDDALYWVPANGDDIDPERQMSIIYDNRSRISLRVKQLLTGKRHTQEPQSRLRRLISNVELTGEDERGIASFASLQEALADTRGGTARDAILYAFDLLHLDGHDLRGLPLEARKARLAALVPVGASGHLRLSEHLDADGAAMAASAEAMEDLKRILAGRSAFYAKADLRFNTSDYDSEEAAFRALRQRVHEATGIKV